MPPARMAAISRRRSAGVRFWSVVGMWDPPACAHDGLRSAPETPSGEKYSPLFTYPVGVRNVGVVCEKMSLLDIYPAEGGNDGFIKEGTGTNYANLTRAS